MSNKPLFYNSRFDANGVGDRLYNADDMTTWLKPFFTTGVFESDLQVVANDDMTVTIMPGYVNIGGKVKEFTQAITLDIPKASGTLNRIDSIVIQRNDTERDLFQLLVEGGFSTNPTPEELVRNEAVYELRLATVNIPAGTIKITQDMITDTRMNNDVCGWVASTVKELDFSQLTVQFEAFFSKYSDDVQAEFERYLESMAGNESTAWAQFMQWFNQVKDQLSTDQAGHLQQNKIELLSSDNLPISSRSDKTFYLEKELAAVETVKVKLQDSTGKEFYLKTSADQVLFEDGKTVQEKFGDVKGMLEDLEDIDLVNVPGFLVDALAVKDLNSNLTAILYEEGEINGIHYRKYINGVLEMWGKQNVGASAAQSVYFPIAFIDSNYFLQASPIYASRSYPAFMVSCQAHSPGTANFYTRQGNGTNITGVNIFWEAKGRWKPKD
ncbi:hypothetical protein LJC51_09005 [Lachnospiraceae bacterium OttesenSCG-928-J05]|nr:hypothetical protein [Lachnospiraceae bacterium OttesenSCG-928-J05]